MKRSLVFATGNQHKLEEVQGLLGKDFALSCLKDVGITEEIPETALTLHENALQKAQYVYNKCHCACFADDTGLEIEALNGQPGVFSARYAGPQKDSNDNMQLVLKNLQGQTNRNAQFRTVIAYINEQGQPFLFEGKVEGTIIETPRGTAGFGYDPIFVPNGYDETFAQLPLETKNAMSHRGRAIQEWIKFLWNE
ncbi:MAG: RdgB/HAM1 family non-canonical purine NTP pyrophosphatase [Paludibacteraceae bacterium]|nr:RdgB/HAM1 family non-canonical purine NTP pyrophosphatase [Paludibacteraceae bacterium]